MLKTSEVFEIRATGERVTRIGTDTARDVARAWQWRQRQKSLSELKALPLEELEKLIGRLCEPPIVNYDVTYNDEWESTAFRA